MNRRTLLGLLGVAPIAGPSSLKAALSGDVSAAACLTSDAPDPYAIASGARIGPSPWSIIGPVRDRREVSQCVAQGHVPPHIGTKRSWSVAFKSHVEMQERAEMREWERRLEAMDQAGLLRIAKLMGLDG